MNKDSFILSTKGIIGPGRRPLAYLFYYVIMVSPLCISIHHYAPPIGCSVTHGAATALAAAVRSHVSEGAMSRFKSITQNELC